MKIKSTSIELWDGFFDGLETKGFNLPKFSDTDEIMIFSDYAGERSDDKFFAYSFYVIDKLTFTRAVADLTRLRKSEPAWKSNMWFMYFSTDRCSPASFSSWIAPNNPRYKIGAGFAACYMHQCCAHRRLALLG